MPRTVATTNDRDFDRFWAAYPRHDGKLAAKRKWDRLNPSPDVVEIILAALEWQRRLPRWQEVDFVPHASTYLHNARWDDEPPPVNGRGHEPTFIPWASADCPHIEAHDSKYRCWQATQLGRPRKAEAS